MTKTIKQCLEYGIGQLTNSFSARLDAELILADVLNIDRVNLITWPDKTVASDNFINYKEKLRSRASNVPMAYILGYKEFWSHKLKVNKYTLIPRPDTETLVQAVLDNVPQPDANILDLGTGSGAIAIALATERKQWHVTATDICQNALQTAEQNAKDLVLDNISFKISDWFEGLAGFKFDAIVANPPYIDNNDPNIDHSTRQHEPHLALFAKDNGLMNYRIIINNASKYLKPNGLVFFEHGFRQATDIQNLFKQHKFSSIKTLKDIANHQRVTYACLTV